MLVLGLGLTAQQPDTTPHCAVTDGAETIRARLGDAPDIATP